MNELLIFDELSRTIVVNFLLFTGSRIKKMSNHIVVKKAIE